MFLFGKQLILWLTRQLPLPQPPCPTRAQPGRGQADAMCAQPRGTLFTHNTFPQGSIQTDSIRMLLFCLIDLKLEYIHHHPIVMALQSPLLLASILGWRYPYRDIHRAGEYTIVGLLQNQLQNCFLCLWTKEEKVLNWTYLFEATSLKVVHLPGTDHTLNCSGSSAWTYTCWCIQLVSYCTGTFGIGPLTSP